MPEVAWLVSEAPRLELRFPPVQLDASLSGHLVQDSRA